MFSMVEVNVFLQSHYYTILNVHLRLTQNKRGIQLVETYVEGAGWGRGATDVQGCAFHRTLQWVHFD